MAGVSETAANVGSANQEGSASTPYIRKKKEGGSETVPHNGEEKERVQGPHAIWTEEERVSENMLSMRGKEDSDSRGHVIYLQEKKWSFY